MMAVVYVGYRRRRKRCRIWQTQVQIVHGEGKDSKGKNVENGRRRQ